MRKLTTVEMRQVSGGFNIGNVVYAYTIGFVVGAASAWPLGPAGMLVGGLVGGFEGAVTGAGAELAIHGGQALITGKDPGITETYY